MKKLLLLLFIPFLSFGQQINTFETFAGPPSGWAYSFSQTNDGNYILITDGIFMVKIDSLGNLISNTDLGVVGRGHAIKQTLDEGFIITGWDNLNDWNKNLILIKTNSMGDTVWTKNFDGLDVGNSWDCGWDVLQNSDSGFIICGIGEDLDGLFTRLIKTDSLGNEVWSKKLEGNQAGLGATSIEHTTDDGYIVAVPGAGLYKVSIEGDQEWVNDMVPFAFDVQQTEDGGYITTGHSATEPNWAGNFYLAKLSSDGVLEWEKVFGDGTEGTNFSYSVQQTEDGGYIMGGLLLSGAFLLKTDSFGNQEWMREFGENIPGGWEVQLTNDGGYAFSVSSMLNGSEWLAGLIKTDSEGNMNFINTTKLPSRNKSIIKTIDILGRETSKGGFQLEIYDDGSVKKKYLIETHP